MGIDDSISEHGHNGIIDMVWNSPFVRENDHIPIFLDTFPIQSNVDCCLPTSHWISGLIVNVPGHAILPKGEYIVRCLRDSKQSRPNTSLGILASLRIHAEFRFGCQELETNHVFFAPQQLPLKQTVFNLNPWPLEGYVLGSSIGLWAKKHWEFRFTPVSEGFF